MHAILYLGNVVAKSLKQLGHPGTPTIEQHGCFETENFHEDAFIGTIKNESEKAFNFGQVHCATVEAALTPSNSFMDNTKPQTLQKLRLPR